MNNYQREKAKRMKKLSKLGVGYYEQKRIFKDYKNKSKELDEIIVQMEIIKNSGILNKIYYILKNLFKGKGEKNGKET